MRCACKERDVKNPKRKYAGFVETLAIGVQVMHTRQWCGLFIRGKQPDRLYTTPIVNDPKYGWVQDTRPQQFTRIA